MTHHANMMRHLSHHFFINIFLQMGKTK